MSNYYLVENEFLNSGKCVYKDDFGNRLQMFRKTSQETWKHEFSAKLRFANADVSADALTISFPIDAEVKGGSLKLKFADGVNHSEDTDIKSAVDMMSNVIHTWIQMIDAIYSININTTEENAKAQLGRLADFAELKDIVQELG